MRKFNKLILLLSLTFLLGSCNKAIEKQFTIQVFSNLPKATLAELEDNSKKIGGSENYSLKQFPPVPERLLVEIVSHSGDLIIVDRTILGTAYDSEELYSLELFRTKENMVELTNQEVPLFINEERSNEKVILENALRVMDIEGIVEDELVELVVVIPKYTSNKEDAFSILKELVGE